jgi:lysozyme
MSRTLKILVLLVGYGLVLWFISFEREDSQAIEDKLIGFNILHVSVADAHASSDSVFRHEVEYRNSGYREDLVRYSEEEVFIVEEIPESFDISGAVELVKRFEGFSHRSYYDLDGKVAIGYGLRRSDIPGLEHGDIITESKATWYLEKSLSRYGEIIDDLVKIQLNENQRNALISLSYNIGPNAFKKSSVLMEINKNNIEEAADAFEYWCKSDGRILRGLVHRRSAEKELFLKE